MKVLFISSLGAMLNVWQPDPSKQTLTPLNSFTVPAPVQYAWQHPVLPLLYVAFSDGSPTAPGQLHGLVTLHVHTDGSLSPFAGSGPAGGPAGPAGGPPGSADTVLLLTQRPIHISVNHDGSFLFIAYNAPSALSVHPISKAGLPLPALHQQEAIDPGIYAHQILVTPRGKTVVLSTRGNDASSIRPEDPGALKSFVLKEGQLHTEQSVAPHGGFGFGPRHVDFHHDKPWMYVSVERQNELQLFELRDGRPAPEAKFKKSTLRASMQPGPRQLAGAVHISSNGRFVYVSNRADATAVHGENEVFAGGENSVAVFEIDQLSGEPTLIQSVDVDAFHPRTFSIHPDGTMLVAASLAPMLVVERRTVKRVAAGLTSFRIHGDGRLEKKHQYDVETGAGSLFWSAMVRGI